MSQVIALPGKGHMKSCMARIKASVSTLKDNLKGKLDEEAN